MRSILLTIGLLIITTYIAIQLLFSTLHIKFEYQLLNQDPNNYQIAIATTSYIRNERDTNQLALKLEQLSLGEKGYTADEINHLIDVRKIMNGLELLAFGSLVGLISYALYTWNKRNTGTFRNELIGAAKFNMAFIIILGILSSLFWEIIFVKFHEVLFPAGNWSFPADSLVITLFPEQFWFNSALFLIILILVQNFGILLFTKYHRYAKIILTSMGNRVISN